MPTALSVSLNHERHQADPRREEKGVTASHSDPPGPTSMRQFRDFLLPSPLLCCVIKFF